MKFKLLFLSIAVLLLTPNLSGAWSYPRDGKFKQLHPSGDGWYFVDEERWDIKAPDKWQHFTGCYVTQKLLSKGVNKYLSALLVFSLGVAKEYEDAYREGWSARDMAVNSLGILSAMYDQADAKVFCTYDQDKIMLNLILSWK